ncbi:hypothetical protein UA18_01225 [Burkholderia multivorans]|uniref:Uncharacterized protein n=1 Tax=Burkholderia multivorans TaxID=87883 RepID=A0ABD7LGR7_9BURK|nr:hypothetical protein UA18_01225 [Burkholderia multivorans]
MMLHYSKGSINAATKKRKDSGIRSVVLEGSQPAIGNKIAGELVIVEENPPQYFSPLVLIPPTIATGHLRKVVKNYPGLAQDFFSVLKHR